MHKLNDYIEEKKIKSTKTPRYGMKKLAVGLVSCILGYTVLVSPSVAYAEEVREPEAVVMEAEEVKEETVLPEETEEAEEEAVEEQEEVVEEENALQVSEEEKEAVTAAETKEEVTEEEKEEKTEEVEKPLEKREEKEETSEEETEKKLVTLDEYNALQEEENEEDGINIEDAVLVSNVLGVTGDETGGEIELSEDVDPEAQAAGEASEEAKRAPKDISNEIKDRQVHLNSEKLLEDENKRIEEENKKRGKFNQIPKATEETIHPDDGEAIGYEVAFTSPKGSIGGDHFTIKLSDNLQIQGIEPYTTEVNPLVIGKETIATGERLDNQTIKYTFTDKINDIRNVRVSIKGYAYIDKTKVKNTTENEEVSIALGDKVDKQTINVKYGDPFYKDKNLNGKSQFTEFNPKTGEYTQVFYINPDSKTITTSNRNWATGKVAMFIDGLTPDESPSDVNYTKENTKVSIQKLPAGTKVPGAIIENPVKTDEETMVKTTFRDGGIEITFAENGSDKLRHNNIDSPYIVIVKSTAAPSETGNNVHSKATLYGEGTRFLILNNSIVTNVGDNEAQGQQVGYFIEHHVYKTKIDGVPQDDKTFTIDSNKMEGADYDDYFTDKSEIEDFKFVKVDTEKLVENPEYNADGTIARGKYKPGKTQEVTYIYERDITSGKFQEHHIYQIYKDGELQSDQTTRIDLEETKGIDEDTFKTSAKANGTNENQKEGFKLEKEENSSKNHIVKSEKITFDLTGAEATLNYINDTKLEVTYYYRKDITTKGSFTEHHVYEVYKDGVKQEDQTTTIDITKTEGTEKESFTTSAKPNGTDDNSKEGFTLVPGSIEKSSEITDALTGAEVTKNYIDKKDLEVKYVYRKDITTKGSFTEHHVYEVYKDGVKQEDQTTTIDITKTEGTEKESFTTSAKPNGTDDNSKEGFTLVPGSIEKSSEITDALTGAEVTKNYIDKKDLEVTYVYRKDITSEKPKEDTPVEEPKEDPTPEDPTPTPVIHEEEKPDPTPDPTPTPEETPVEEPKEDPAPKHEEEKPAPKEEPKTEEPKEEETPEETPVEEAKEEEKEVVTEKEEDDEADRSKDTTPKHEGKEDYSKAPQTGVAGAAGYLGLAGLGTALLAALEDKKKKKNK